MTQTPELKLMAREFKERYWHQNPIIEPSSPMKKELWDEGDMPNLEPMVGETPEMHIQE